MGPLKVIVTSTICPGPSPYVWLEISEADPLSQKIALIADASFSLLPLFTFITFAMPPCASSEISRLSTSTLEDPTTGLPHVGVIPLVVTFNILFGDILI